MSLSVEKEKGLDRCIADRREPVCVGKLRNLNPEGVGLTSYVGRTGPVILIRVFFQTSYCAGWWYPLRLYFPAGLCARSLPV
jgi:hypothetical protein